MSKTYSVSKNYLEDHFHHTYMMVDDLLFPEGVDGPGVSVTRAGKQWFWIAAQDHRNTWRMNYSNSQEQIDYPLKGYAPTKQEAIDAGLSAIGFTPSSDIPDFACEEKDGYYLLREITKTQKDKIRGYHGASSASSYLRYIAAAKKANAPESESEDGQALKFAYVKTFMCSPEKHKILKRTKKRVYIDAERYREDGPITYKDPVNNYYMQRKIVVDRERFDAGEEIRISSGYCTHVFSEARMKQRQLEDIARDAKAHDEFVSRFKFLSLVHPVTRSSIKSAYRSQAKAMHPDAGGDQEQFIMLKQEYESAMAMVG